VLSPENFEITRERGFKLHGMKSRYRRRAQRMEPDDRVLIYVSEWRKWPATARITSKYFQDRSPVWKSPNGKNEDYPYRVNMRPDIVLKERDFIDAMELAPRLEYIKRWPPEIWPLAFMDSLHLIPQRDYRLVEGEMKRIVNRGRKRRRRRDERDGDRPEARRDDGHDEPAGEDVEVSLEVEVVPSDDVLREEGDGDRPEARRDDGHDEPTGEDVEVSKKAEVVLSEDDRHDEPAGDAVPSPEADGTDQDEQPQAALNGPVESAPASTHEDEASPPSEEAQVEAEVAGPDEANGAPGESERTDELLGD